MLFKSLVRMCINKVITGAGECHESRFDEQVVNIIMVGPRKTSVVDLLVLAKTEVAHSCQ